jgi:hypothetical protein
VQQRLRRHGEENHTIWDSSNGARNEAIIQRERSEMAVFYGTGLHFFSFIFLFFLLPASFLAHWPEVRANFEGGIYKKKTKCNVK